jgi:hypothetical protein
MRWRFGLTLIFILFSFLLTKWPSAWQPLLNVVYVEHFYPAWQSFVQFFPTFRNIALVDILYVAIPLLFILRIVWLLRKNLIRRTLSILVEIGLWGSTLYLLFMLTWGMNYHREPLYESLKNQGFTTTLSEGHWDFAFQETLKTLAAMPDNFEYCPTEPLYFNGERPAAFAHSALALANQPAAPSRVVTSTAWSWLLTRLGIAGVYQPYTGEPTYNSDIYEHAKPFVMTHEYGHWAGYAREYDADIVAYWSLWLSPDPVWQYSAWLEWWREIAAPHQYYNKMPQNLKDGLTCYVDHLRAQPRWEIRKTFWLVYETNLKNQGIHEGLKTYKMGEAMALSSFQDWLYKKANR